jgi:hypothetical protein
VFASAGAKRRGALKRAGAVAVDWCDPPIFAVAAIEPCASRSVNHAAAPLWSCGKWNGKRLFMTCINLSYPDGSAPDDPGGSRSSSILTEDARPPP